MIEMASIELERKSSIELEPRTLSFRELQLARVYIPIYIILYMHTHTHALHASDLTSYIYTVYAYCLSLKERGLTFQESAISIMKNNSLEEAMKIFTHVTTLALIYIYIID